MALKLLDMTYCRYCDVAKGSHNSPVRTPDALQLLMECVHAMFMLLKGTEVIDDEFGEYIPGLVYDPDSRLDRTYEARQDPPDPTQ